MLAYLSNINSWKYAETPAVQHFLYNMETQIKTHELNLKNLQLKEILEVAILKIVPEKYQRLASVFLSL